jgi:dTDP-4-dehydrorhamnose 3,5-epimerase
VPTFTSTALPGVVVVEPDVLQDERGFFLETYHEVKYRQGGIAPRFVQDNHSRSVRGTIRGLHLQLRQPQGKLIRAIAGKIYDVAVDVRRGSPTFGRWVSVVLSAGNFRQCYVPPGFAHGFAVLSDYAEVEYKCTAVYDGASEIGIVWNDPTLAIAWPISSPLLSARDSALPAFEDAMDRLPLYPSTDL